MADIWGRLDATADNRMPSHRLMDWAWNALPQKAQQAFAPWGQLMNPLEWTPGAGVRDMVNSSGDMSRATMAGDPMGMLGAGAGMALGAIGAIPGGKLMTKGAEAATDASKAAIKALEPDKWGYFKSAVPGTAGADLHPRAFNLDNEKFSIALSKRIASDLLRDFGMKRQGSSKWSHYGVDRETGSSLRVSNHAAQNLGSLGANTGREMSVVVDPAAGELVLASPAIRSRTGLDEVRLEMPDDEFGKLATPEGRAWLLDILQHGGTR